MTPFKQELLNELLVYWILGGRAHSSPRSATGADPSLVKILMFRASPASLVHLLKACPTWPLLRLQGQFVGLFTSILSLCTLLSFAANPPRAALEGRAGFSTFSTQADVSVKYRDCSVHRCCLKVGFRAHWNSHLENSCANYWDTFLQIYSAKFQISSLHHLFRWLTPQFLDHLGTLGLGYAANLSYFSSCGGFNEAYTVLWSLVFLIKYNSHIHSFSVSPPRQIWLSRSPLHTALS